MNKLFAPVVLTAGASVTALAATALLSKPRSVRESHDLHLQKVNYTPKKREHQFGDNTEMLLVI